MDDPQATGLLDFIDASPSPYHAVATVARHLESNGFTATETGSPGSTELPSHGYLVRGGMLLAWHRPPIDPDAPVRVIAAHTDSPNLRVKPRPDLDGFGLRRLAMEPYGGALLNSWLDRDLGIAGRASVRTAASDVEDRLFRDDRPLIRVPQLAIHLDRDITEKGLLLNRQLHLNGVWGLGSTFEGEFREWVADQIGVDEADVLAWDAMCHDTLPAGFLGPEEELISAARLDNLCSCFGAMTALVSAARQPDAAHISMIALFDHEEVGSESATGAASPWLATMISALGGGTSPASMASSRCLSADMAHGVHPNYPDRHEPNHRVQLGGGPVVKSNVNQRYATDATTSGEFIAACERADVPVQQYSHRSDLACGSTIGPITAARLGIATVDVGMPQLSMHSARELMATPDVAFMTSAFGEWLRSPVTT